MFLHGASRRSVLLACVILPCALIGALAFPAAPASAAAALSATANHAAAQDSTSSHEPVKLKLDKKSVKIKNDGKVKLNATPVFASEENRSKVKVSWRVSDTRVARVSQSGVVQGKTAGTTRVIAETQNGRKAVAKVKVVIQKGKMATKIPVLTYHRITSDKAKRTLYKGDSLAVSQGMFERQMKWLESRGYRTISTAELKSWRVNGTFLPKKSILVTIDDGFYETYHVAYPILRKYNLKATSFVIGRHVKAQTRRYNPKSKASHFLGKDVIDEVRRDYPNLEFQSHTYNMHKRARNGYGVAKTWKRARIDADFAKNGKFGFTSIAYPFGHYSSTMIAAARATHEIKIGFGYIMWEPATRTSPLFNMPRFKVMGDGSMGDFVKIARTAR